MKYTSGEVADGGDAVAVALEGVGQFQLSLVVLLGLRLLSTAPHSHLHVRGWQVGHDV